MFEGQVHDPQVFIAVLREYHETIVGQRARPGDGQSRVGGDLANTLSELIIGKRVDLAAVRQELLDTGEHELADTLNRLVDLIEPYIEEGGVEE